MPFSMRLFRHFPAQCADTYHAGAFLKLPLAYFTGFWSLITLLLLSSGPAYAEWVDVGGNESGMTVYVDSDSIRQKGNLVKMWQLYDYKTVQTRAGTSFCQVGNNTNSTARKSACKCMRLRGSRAIWETAKWFLTTPTKASGDQLHHVG